MRQYTSAVAGEWHKLAGLRSTWWALTAIVVVACGLAGLFGALFEGYPQTAEDARAFDPMFPTGLALSNALLAVVAFAVLAMGGERSGRSLQTSLLAVPRRGVLYLAKLTVTMLLVLAVCAVTVPVSFLLSQRTLGDLGVGFDAPGAVEMVAGSTLYLLLMAVFAFGLTGMLRRSALVLALLMPLLFLSSQGLGNIPAIKDVVQWFPDQGGQIILHVVPEDDSRFAKDYGAWTGLAVVAGWAALTCVGGWLVTRRSEG
ncbi:hypothetical protein LX16_3705 [Stackebrandtia albiflava]|uniref:ABC-2 type transport system permease protein n=1 Tax=Stackebrandtia albiflava TaxID=406432 RepID=A0A562V541_9ACTN|nr:ABC transporter permease [Stackebrandtia albiflava]TWJ12938.1 hypothetical protein LX16_3705 [Stackebrandtia albiflava]